MFNLATARVTTSNNSSYCGDRVGKKPVLSTSSSSEGDRWNTGPALWGEETAERASEPRERAVDLAGEDRDRGLPVSNPSAKSNCEPHECSHRSASAEAGPAPWGALAKTPSLKRVLRERSVWIGSRSQCGQPAYSKADSACFAPKQTTHRLCVSPLVMKRGQGVTHCLYCEPLSPLFDLKDAFDMSVLIFLCLPF